MGKVQRKFGLFLKTRRLKANMTQSHLAEKLGYRPQFVANWERGMSNPPEMILPKISTLLKVPKADIIQFLVKERRENLDILFKRIKN